MKIRLESVGEVTLVVAEGRLDFGASPRFQEHLEQALTGSGQAPTAVVVDCAALEYVSSAGLRVFLLAARTAQRAGMSFALTTLTPAVREVFELSGFIRMIPVHTERAAALASASPTPAVREERTTAANEEAQLEQLTAFLKSFWSAAQLPPASALPFELALEEIFMNTVMHGAPAGQTRVEVTLSLAGRELTLTVADDGPPFDPLSLPAPDTTAGLEERRVGGQGVHLVRQMMEAVAYQRVGPLNVLRMRRQIDG